MVRLSCTKQMDSAQSSMRIRTLSIVHLRHTLFCFFVNSQSHPYNSNEQAKPQLITSKGRDQLQARAHWWSDARTLLSHC